jgi:hypothetical protein
MNAALLMIALAAWTPADAPEPEPNPLAPSLPKLSREEQVRIEKVIDRFILFETGKLTKAEAAQAVADFTALGPEATFQLIEGLNRAANIESSCPVVIIARKLARILGASADLDLLDFARENIGAGVTARRHMNVVKDLRVACIVRKGALQRANLAAGYRPGEKAPRQMTLAELASSAGSERGPRLKAVLVELEQRRGEKVLTTLGSIAASADADVGELARGLIVRHLGRQGVKAVREALTAESAQVRAAAAKAAAAKRLPCGEELISLLTDSDAAVRQAAHQALVQLSKGQDYGPAEGASETERSAAVQQWRAWWSKQGGR